MKEIEFKSLPENVTIVESLLEQLKEEFNLSEEMEANMLVSLSEAVNNAISHGNALDAAKNVKLKMDVNKQQFFFTAWKMKAADLFLKLFLIQPHLNLLISQPAGEFF